MSLNDYFESASFCARVTREEGHSIPDWYIRGCAAIPAQGLRQSLRRSTRRMRWNRIGRRAVSESFRVGEIVIGVGPFGLARRVGEECEILSPLAWTETWDTSTGAYLGYDWYHAVRWLSDGAVRYQLPSQLRKRRPPQDWVKLCNLANVGETRPAESPGCSTQELRSDAEVAARTGRLPSRTVEHCAGGGSAARDWRVS